MDEAADRIGVSSNTMQRMLSVVQGLEPAGVAATDLRQCLVLQLEYYYPHTKNARILVTDYLEAVAEKKWAEIAAALHISEQEVTDLVDMIKSLDPKPGARFDSQTSNSPIIPDLYVKVEHGQLFMQTNDRLVPTIRISNDFTDLLQIGDTEVKTYLRDKYKKATWLSKSLEQRRYTLQKIMQAIVEKQQAFFENGTTLQPLTIKEIASRCDVHESTVSRATNDKYAHTPFGIFELKYFFSTGIPLQDGNYVSAHSIQQKIKTMIDGENPIKPLSDQMITTILNQEGVMISRRTVAKYREKLLIPSTSKRKRKTNIR
ncbi:RNA polymerase factor sigma-54 [Virgibacillus senegalensis]|uniref:RNA polymerase factor sigma-54 n=1 Tax=Virgibacillus senegalensis TaxID=1499679 RepID=UPI0018FE949A|nr:RNA polymerase factor sigma-54 [Virgibacillus senegalensis]